MMMIMGC